MDTPEGVPPSAQAAGTPSRGMGGGRYTTGSLASRVWSSDVPRIMLRAFALGPPRRARPRLSASAPRTTSVVRPADPRTLMERRGVRLPQSDGSSGDREARRRRQGAGGERSGRVGGSPASLSSRQGALHASGRSSLGGYPQCPTVVKRTRHEVRGVLEARDIELSSASAPRHEIHRQLGAACDRFRGFCNTHAAELGLRNRFCAHDARRTDGADHLGGPLVRWGWLMR